MASAAFDIHSKANGLLVLCISSQIFSSAFLVIVIIVRSSCMRTRCPSHFYERRFFSNCRFTDMFVFLSTTPVHHPSHSLRRQRSSLHTTFPRLTCRRPREAGTAPNRLAVPH